MGEHQQPGRAAVGAVDRRDHRRRGSHRLQRLSGVTWPTPDRRSLEASRLDALEVPSCDPRCLGRMSDVPIVLGEDVLDVTLLEALQNSRSCWTIGQTLGDHLAVPG